MGFHWPELIIITIVALLIFGPKRLPEIGGAIGNTYKEFRKSLNDLTESTKPDAEGGRRESDERDYSHPG